MYLVTQLIFDTSMSTNIHTHIAILMTTCKDFSLYFDSYFYQCQIYKEDIHLSVCVCVYI